MTMVAVTAGDAVLGRLGERIGQRLPAGDDYLYLPDAETGLLAALATLANDPFLRSLLEHTVGSGQRQLLISRKDLPPRVATTLSTAG